MAPRTDAIARAQRAKRKADARLDRALADEAAHRQEQASFHDFAKRVNASIDAAAKRRRLAEELRTVAERREI